MSESEKATPSSWEEITEWVESFPLPETSITTEGEINDKRWIFRGVKDSCYPLEPSIERHAKSKAWSGLLWRLWSPRISKPEQARTLRHPWFREMN